MTDLLAQLMATGNTALAAGFVVFLRVGAVMATLPAFGEHSVPQRVRLMLTLAFTAIVFPAVADDVLARLAGRPPPVPVLLAEITTGLALGMALRLFVAVLQTAGSIAAQSTSLAQILGSAGVEPMPAMGHLMVVSGLAVAVMSGLHLRVSEALIGSYTVFPPGVFPSPAALSEWGIARVAATFAFAFSLAAPFVIASFIYNLALGVINKAMPQLMVAFVGAPAITAGGLLLLLLTLPIILPLWNRAFATFLANPFGAGP
ncbi:MAG: flagellar biosynthesis protein FliR [Maritimibacter sp.]|nr:flagellar biosynthesis protein FliR [Maritimibacter sp.]